MDAANRMRRERAIDAPLTCWRALLPTMRMRAPMRRRHRNELACVPSNPA